MEKEEDWRMLLQGEREHERERGGGGGEGERKSSKERRDWIRRALVRVYCQRSEDGMEKEDEGGEAARGPVQIC